MHVIVEMTRKRKKTSGGELFRFAFASFTFGHTIILPRIFLGGALQFVLMQCNMYMYILYFWCLTKRKKKKEEEEDEEGFQVLRTVLYLLHFRMV